MRIYLLAFLLAGCMATPDAAPGGDPDDTSEAPPGEPDPGAMPEWTSGQTWTYRTLGYWDHRDEVTLVAVDDGGWTLAGATADDLLDEVAWDRPYFGPVDLGDGEGMLRFPMDAGTTWQLWGSTMAAVAANITWAGRTEPGFRATGDNLLVEYAPGAGYVTRFEERDSAGDLASGLELVSTGHTTQYVMLERAGEGIVSGSTATTTITIEAADEVIAWMLSEAGATQVVTSPSAAVRSYEGRGGRDFQVERLPAEDGDWTFGGTGDVYMQLHGVRWIQGTT